MWIPDTTLLEAQKILLLKIKLWIQKIFYYWIVTLGSIVTVLLVGFWFLSFGSQLPTLPQKAILKLHLSGNLQEKSHMASLGMNNSNSLFEICDLIKKASKDSHIEGIFVKLSSLSLSFAQIQELQVYLKQFKQTGKKLYLYTSSFSSTAEYYFAAIFDEICLLPVGQVGIAGFRVEVPFARALLDKWEVTPNDYHAGKYKSFPETFTQKDFTPEHKESALSLLSSMEETVIKDIGVWRKIDNAQSLFEIGDLQANKALDSKLVTELGYYESFKEKILGAHGKECEFFSAKKYHQILSRGHRPSSKRIAILNLSGSIYDDYNGGSPLSDQKTIRPSKVVKALKALMKDSSVLAVIAHIDSPGGVVTASEEIWAIFKEFSKKKPIIASMGTVAASGGYYIATGCSKIVAQPLTITGSIGVFGGKLNTSKFWENLGVHWGEIYTMESATLHSSNHDFSKAQKEKMEKSAYESYDIFKQRVSQSRHLTLAQVEEVAQGRVWTGVQAKEKNLVDELGGIQEAFHLAQKELNLTGEDIQIYIHSPKTGLYNIILNLLEMEYDDLNLNVFLYSFFPFLDFKNAYFNIRS
jgi:protease-4